MPADRKKISVDEFRDFRAVRLYRSIKGESTIPLLLTMEEAMMVAMNELGDYAPLANLIEIAEDLISSPGFILDQLEEKGLLKRDSSRDYLLQWMWTQVEHGIHWNDVNWNYVKNPTKQSLLHYFGVGVKCWWNVKLGQNDKNYYNSLRKKIQKQQGTSLDMRQHKKCCTSGKFFRDKYGSNPEA